mmetsp:Transcript_18219/g.32014  ORF Transcript_18219/g.32014 Transcript_18219/m.32014 type:complete len:529 (+) Transcript_18219:54-1640(+)|eukprot:CAMPEP_0197625472 /NCGR_PEP_ID=MMETSP1338-20131121/4828_1 /TAXON_ID=43686 ORGANISM="Pelagodinium beii, Strain RCC1491" /NCGR_SAMPLE_ID=MMETSP1338 /ASSEMBLY_ACC=CAM_ASM_000754 /LENGTH=528 /DNA_ID=CAMNT_0043195891 /DNA_START=54 /DNA_END=1640 /DNA_ORIENTATION=-
MRDLLALGEAEDLDTSLEEAEEDAAESTLVPTLPPLRLRMVSADVLCIRSMEVEWKDVTGACHTWSSWDDAQNGWYEAEKLLPSSAREVKVRFKVQGLGGPWDVCRVDRHRGKCWVTSKDGRSNKKEVIRIRSQGQTTSDAVDAVFELKGPMHGCWVNRAWNAANASSEREFWEYWRDGSRPAQEESPLTLQAADGAAPSSYCLQSAPSLACYDDGQIRLICSMKRMCAASKELLKVHSRTVQGLRSLDDNITGQWVGANVGTTTSAGLGIASAVLLFLAPPVGLGIGIGSAVTGGLTWAGDSVADKFTESQIKRQLSEDAREAFVVAELLREWMSCQESIGAAAAGTKPLDSTEPCGAAGLWAMSPVDAGLMAGVAAQSTGSGATNLARTAANVGAAATVAAQVLGVAGALIGTGLAVRGWSTTKSNQLTVRAKIEELLLRILQVQHLIAAVDRLECPICLDPVTLADEVRHCCDFQHCFHAQCLEQRRQSLGIEGADCCPVCTGPMDAEEESKVESADRFRQEHFS